MKYKKPEMEIIKLLMEDVITASLNSGGQMGSGESENAGESGLF